MRYSLPQSIEIQPCASRTHPGRQHLRSLTPDKLQPKIFERSQVTQDTVLIFLRESVQDDEEHIVKFRSRTLRITVLHMGYNDLNRHGETKDDVW